MIDDPSRPAWRAAAAGRWHREVDSDQYHFALQRDTFVDTMSARSSRVMTPPWARTVSTMASATCLVEAEDIRRDLPQQSLLSELLDHITKLQIPRPHEFSQVH